MTDVIRLATHGIRLFHGRLYNHDYLWFSSNEMSRVSVTQPLLHNYALCYALSQRSYRTYVGSTPKYVEDPDGEFNSMPVYSTPGKSTRAEHTTMTFNAVDSMTVTTGESKKMNTPNLGKRVFLNLIWEPLDAPFPSRGYEFYVFVFHDYRLPSAFRLGKKGTTVRVRWSELEDPRAVFRDGPVSPSHVVNPLDVSGEVTRYDPVSLPPHLLLRTATVEADWFVMKGQHCVHVPKRVLSRMGVGQ